MFRNKISYAELKKDDAPINMVLAIETSSQNPIVVTQWEKEPRKTKTIDDWEKEE